MKKAIWLLLGIFSIACSKKEDPNTLKVAATPVPHAQMLEFVKPKLEKEGVHLKIIQVDDYNIPNRALAEGEVDANFFQHIPFMKEQIKAFGYPIVCYARIHLEPMGLYSQKIQALHDLPPKGVVALPNDPTNEYRALKLLEQTGFITLKPGSDLTATIATIQDNPKKLIFREVDAAMLPRTLHSVDLAAIPTNFALQGHLNPERDALALESKDSPYANIIAIYQQTGSDPRLAKLHKAMLSDAMRSFIIENYRGAIIPVLQPCE